MLEEDDVEIAKYFKSKLLNCRNSLSLDEFRKFVCLDKNSDRVQYVLNYPEVYKLPIEVEEFPEKCSEKSTKLKETGNTYFGQGHFMKSLETYSNAILISPAKDVGVLLANRSAALYNLELFELALIDIEQSLKVGYPKELEFKVEERRARCYLALKVQSKATECFRKTLQLLDFAKLSIERKQKMESDIRVMLAVIEKGKELSAMKKQSTNIINNQDTSTKSDNLLDKISDPNPLYPAASSSVEFRKSSDEIGRYAVAVKDIEPGEVLIIEKRHSSFLLGEYRLNNCNWCFKKNVAPYPAACNSCSLIAYCSPKCRDADAKVHKIECCVLGPLWLSNASITCLLALKAVIQTPFNKLISLKDSFSESKNFEPSMGHPFKANDYICYWSLVTHEDERTAEDLFHRAFMAAWLFRVLKTTTYFSDKGILLDSPGHLLSDDEAFVAGLLLHHIQLLQFNTHEISELKVPKHDKKLVNAKNIFIGGGIYPTTALLNHSCNPGIVRYFVGTTMVVRAVRSIKKGMEISDNYGPMFTNEASNQRQRQMRLKYWFNCQCEACKENWPLLDYINPKILRFKCETGISCGNILIVNTDSSEFMALCKKCNKSTNLIKGLKALQDTDSLFKSASIQLEQGQNTKAFKYYINILKLLDEFLALPIKDYFLAQQGIRITVLCFGNTVFT